MESRPVLWYETDDICKDRNVTKKAWRYVGIGFKEDFEVPGFDHYDDTKTT